MPFSIQNTNIQNSNNKCCFCHLLFILSHSLCWFFVWNTVRTHTNKHWLQCMRIYNNQNHIRNENETKVILTNGGRQSSVHRNPRKWAGRFVVKWWFTASHRTDAHTHWNIKKKHPSTITCTPSIIGVRIVSKMGLRETRDSATGQMC